MANDKIELKSDSIKWYSTNKKIFEQLSKKVESIIHEIIDDQKIPVHAIYCRTKEIESFSKKIEDHKYTDPKTQITDLSGIRIITYVESDLEKISTIIKSHFIIDPENSVNKTDSLGTDKVGYRSIHFIAKLPSDRIKLPEYRKFDNLYFEIQIRTILQHAWAEIEHDKNYKFTGKLPTYLIRRFTVLAGVLELADREFNDIAYEIDQYSNIVNKNTEEGNLNISIDTTSLKSFLSVRFKELISEGKIEEDFAGNENKIIEELELFGILTLKQLDEIIPQDFINREKEFNYTSNNFLGLTRNILMINDAEKYFKKSWRNSWGGIPMDAVNLIKSYNLDIENILLKFKIDYS